MTALTKLIGSLLALCALAYIAFFAVANSAETALTLWPQMPPYLIPVWLVALIAFCLGLLVVAIIANIRISALRIRHYRLQKQLDKLTAQNEADKQTRDESTYLTNKAS